MNGNGNRTALVNPSGAAVNSSEWEAPKGSSPYFGFLDSKGASTPSRLKTSSRCIPIPMEDSSCILGRRIW